MSTLFFVSKTTNAMLLRGVAFLWYDGNIMYSKSFAEIYDAFGWDTFSHTVHNMLGRETRGMQKVLDVACGTGTLADLMQKDGHAVTGIDVSNEMLKKAKQKNSKVKFLVADMNDFELGETFSLVTCMFDSINHIRNWRSFFKRVHRHLSEDGVFVFDFNTVAGLREWSTPFETQNKNGVCNFSGTYDAKKRSATLTLTCSKNQKKGTPACVVLDERFVSYTYTVKEVEKWLSEAGFTYTRITAPNRSPKRIFYSCRKKHGASSKR